MSAWGEAGAKGLTVAAETPGQLWQLIPEVFNELFLLNRLC